MSNLSYKFSLSATVFGERKKDYIYYIPFTKGYFVSGIVRIDEVVFQKVLEMWKLMTEIRTHVDKKC